MSQTTGTVASVDEIAGGETTEQKRRAAMRKDNPFVVAVTAGGEVGLKLAGHVSDDGYVSMGHVSEHKPGHWVMTRNGVAMTTGQSVHATRRDCMYQSIRNLLNHALIAQVDPTERKVAQTLKTQLTEKETENARLAAQVRVMHAVMTGQKPTPADVAVVGGEFMKTLRK